MLRKISKALKNINILDRFGLKTIIENFNFHGIYVYNMKKHYISQKINLSFMKIKFFNINKCKIFLKFIAILVYCNNKRLAHIFNIN